MEVSGQYHALDDVEGPGPNPRERASGSCWIGGWICSRASLYTAVAKKKNPIPCRESNPGLPARSLVTILTELPRLFPFVRMSFYLFNLAFYLSAHVL
jgi:hypothetical protein